MNRSAALALLLLSSDLAYAQSPQPTPTPPAYSEQVQVTASRIPETIDSVPESIQVITAQELRDRGATDLKSALAMAAGVDIAPGGDGGPAASVPEFWGLREFDAFLLVVDGVPWGGAFNPALSTLDLRDVDHIEVQRGPAPVMYGATSFVGVIQVVRRAPGHKGTHVYASGGSHTSGILGVAAGLPGWAGFDSSVSADFERRGFEDERSSFKKTHLLWRNRRAAGAGFFSFDLDGTFLRQQPASPTPREGRVLSDRVPIDSNQNPEGAYLDEDRLFARFGYDRTLSVAAWSTTLSFTHSGQQQFRGFLTEVSSVFPNARGFRADIDTNDLYFDTHLAWTKSPSWHLVAGADYLFGKAEAKGDTFDYGVELDGDGAPSDIPTGELRRIEDTRNFMGLYANLEWLPTGTMRFDVGVSLNHTDEERGEMLSDVELTRAAIQVRRQALVTAVMDLEGREAEAFWPLYRDYRAAMATVNDRYVKLVVTYLDTFDKLADDAATGLLTEALSIERARLDVKSQFIPRFGQVMPARKVARFFQIDNKLDKKIQAELAADIPLTR